MNTIPDALLNQPVAGVNVEPATLADTIGTEPTLLVFLRHFGCLFCREMVNDLRKAKARNTEYPDVLFFYQGTVAQGEAFFGASWPGARAIADLPRTFYHGFGIDRGTVGQLIGPEVWACGIRAVAKGHFAGAIIGDPRMMPGLFLVQGDRLLWRHDFRHAGDHPDFAAIPDHHVQNNVPAA